MKNEDPDGGDDVDADVDGGDPDGPPPIDAPPEMRQVTVTVDVGTGAGTVTANVGGIDCGSACSAEVVDGTEITFTASSSAGSSFAGWRDAAASCGAATTCTLTVDGAPLAVGARFAQHGTAAWAAQLGGVGGEGNVHVAGDADGNVYVVASHTGEITFDGTTYPAVGSTDIIVAKLSPAGDVIWKRAIAGAGEHYAEGIAVVRQTGDLVVFGAYGANTSFGGPTPLALMSGDTKDFFVVKYAAGNGGLIWQRAIHADDADDPGLGGVAVDGNGDIYVTGAFNTLVNLGDGNLTTTSGEQEVFLGRLAGTDGAVVWKRKLGGVGSGIFANDITVDGNGYVYVAGYFVGTCNLGGVNMTPSGQQDGFVGRFTGSTGGFSWQRQVGGTGSDSVATVAVDVNGVVSMGVSYQAIVGENVTFAGQALTGTGTGTETVVGAVTSVNTFSWARRYGGNSTDQPVDLAVLADGTLVLTGYFSSTSIVFGSTTLSNSGQSDMYVARLSPTSGTASWAARINGTGFDVGESAARAGNVLAVAGRFQSQVNALGKTLTSRGGYDVFAAAVPLPPP
ncbi:MAG: SBBP repeat-containing protein [Deltaproteobacteria bacterium]|nr:SBBP repeat-containing protein [Kofleriaceae bacterium]